MKRWQAKLIGMYDFTRNALNDELLSHLQRLSREIDVSFGQDFSADRLIEEIHNTVLASAKKCTIEYLIRVIVL